MTKFIPIEPVIKSLKTIISILIITFSNTKDTIIRVIIGLLNNDKICSYVTKVIKSLKTIQQLALTVIFLNTKDTIIRAIIGLVK